jgi:hypothetical protein
MHRIMKWLTLNESIKGFGTLEFIKSMKADLDSINSEWNEDNVLDLGYIMRLWEKEQGTSANKAWQFKEAIHRNAGTLLSSLNKIHYVKFPSLKQSQSIEDRINGLPNIDELTGTLRRMNLQQTKLSYLDMPYHWCDSEVWGPSSLKVFVSQGCIVGNNWPFVSSLISRLKDLQVLILSHGSLPVSSIRSLNLNSQASLHALSLAENNFLPESHWKEEDFDFQDFNQLLPMSLKVLDLSRSNIFCLTNSVPGVDEIKTQYTELHLEVDDQFDRLKSVVPSTYGKYTCC